MQIRDSTKKRYKFIQNAVMKVLEKLKSSFVKIILFNPHFEWVYATKN